MPGLNMKPEDVQRAMEAGWTIQQLATLDDFIRMLEEHGIDAVEQMLGVELIDRFRSALNGAPLSSVAPR